MKRIYTLFSFLLPASFKKTFYVFLFAVLSGLVSYSQDLDWNTVSYTQGSTSANFGSIGSPSSTVSLNIAINGGSTTFFPPPGDFPTIYVADPPGSSDDCSVPCALRSVVSFGAMGDNVVYTFTFSTPVTGLSFRLYDIDGDDATNGDQATVSATDGAAVPQNITMVTFGGPSITGSGSTTAVARGTQGSTADEFVDVSIISGITTLTIIFENNPNNPGPNNHSFSIGNMDWSGVLPVKWVSFSGKPQSNGNINLKWIAQDSPDGNYYTIERSKNAQSYIPIGQVNIANTGEHSYTFTDLNPGSGNSFYRIRETDKTGHYEFSNIVLIKAGINADQLLTIFPNPAKDYIMINIADNVQLGKVQIYDIKGRLLYQSQNARNRIETSSFKSGIYCLRIEDASGKMYQTSFLKQ